MKEKKLMFVNIDASKKLKASIYLYKDKKNNCLINLHKVFENETTFSGDDFFASFCKLRNWVYKKGQLFPMCKGALINVYPSRMSRQMSNGMKAYYLTLGKQAEMNDIVDIFEPIREDEIIKLSTSEQQTEYFKKWIKSL
ncbi:hypothetical protein OOZ15_05340 [Galbibacter sp. EGI 63066]|uniref:hypothetical protein n=1 Tax=Galbibacter sp. EGI 63066 TaxID=2993559 RepID=UPI0022493F23|nr:hypothetical protein [Galbibacter sp. EGI 63066]MCX2679360.1 hypothetical protein [Galbibacter sp. EGI 63066]